MSLAFADFQIGDILQILYHGAQVSLMQITKVNNFSVEGLDGTFACKLTKVGIGKEYRFYAELGPNRQSVLRWVKWHKYNPVWEKEEQANRIARKFLDGEKA